jgi:hypothetical protein
MIRDMAWFAGGIARTWRIVILPKNVSRQLADFLQPYWKRLFLTERSEFFFARINN